MTFNRIEKLSFVRKLTSYKSHACQRTADEIPQELWADREFVEMAIRKHAEHLEHTSDEFRATKDIVLKCVKSDGSSLEHASDALRADRDVALAALAEFDYPAGFISPSLLEDRAFALECINQQPGALGHLPEALRDDAEVVLAAVSRDGQALSGASERLKQDIDIVTTAIKQTGYAAQHSNIPVNLELNAAIRAVAEFNGAYDHLTEDLKGNRAIRMACLAGSGEVDSLVVNTGEEEAYDILLKAKGDWDFDWTTVESELWADPDFARAACIKDIHALKHVPTSFQSDKLFMLSVIHGGNGMLPKVAYVFESNEDICRAAVKQQSSNFKLFSDSLRGDRKFVLSLLAAGCPVLEHVTPALQADRDLVLTAIPLHGDQMRHASEDLRGDKELVLIALRETHQHGHSSGLLEHLSADLRGDREVVLAAVEACGGDIQFASDTLRSDRALVLVAVANDHNVLGTNWQTKKPLVPETFRSDSEVIHTMLAYGGECGIQFADAPFRGDREIMMDCVAWNYSNFQYATEELKNDVESLRELMKISLDIFNWVSDDIKSQVLALGIQTPEYRSRRLASRVIPSERVAQQAFDVIDVRAVQGDRILASAAVMTMVEWEEHGPCGSYLRDSAWNSLTLIGDFLFYVSHRGLDGERSSEGGSFLMKESKPDVQDRADETWIVDLPSDGIRLELTRHGGGRQLTSADMHLVSKGSTPPTGVGICNGEGRSFYEALGEVVKGADPSTFEKFGQMKEGVFEVYMPASISACGGAARIHVDGLGHRWIFPTEDGHCTWAELKSKLDNTGHSDDWNALRDGFLTDATEQERKLVAEHFREVGDQALQVEVAEFFE